jgi:hypothetical protein
MQTRRARGGKVDAESSITRRDGHRDNRPAVESMLLVERRR